MHPRELGRRVNAASQRIAQAADDLPKSYGADVARLTLATPTARKYPEDGQMEQLEAVAELMEAIIGERKDGEKDVRHARKEQKEALAALEADRDGLKGRVADLQAQVSRLTAELDALKRTPQPPAAVKPAPPAQGEGA